MCLTNQRKTDAKNFKETKICIYIYIWTNDKITDNPLHSLGFFSPRDFTVHRHSLNIMQNIEICFLKCAITTSKRKLPIVPYFICALVTSNWDCKSPARLLILFTSLGCSSPSSNPGLQINKQFC